MKPTNSKERKSLYLQFLLLYILSVIIIVITMHFYYSVPKKELNMLRAQKTEFNTAGAIPRMVIKQMKKADSLLLIIADPNKAIDQPLSEINEALRTIKSLGEKNKNSMDSLFLNIHNNYFEILSAKKESRNGSSTAGNYKELNSKYLDLKEKFEKCDLDNTKLTTQLQMLQGGK